MRTPSCIHSVLLLSSNHCNWVGLRAILQKQRDLHIVGEVVHADEVLPSATKLRPDVIFAPVKLEGMSIAPLLAQVHARCPEIKVIVLGDEPAHDELMQLGQVGVDGYLLWGSLSRLVLHCCLAAVMEAGLWVGSPAAVEKLVAPPEPCHSGIELTSQEGVVLKGLVAGFTQREIAQVAHMSEPTVWRTTASLCAKFAVPTPRALCAKAALLGFVPLATDPDEALTPDRDRSHVR